MFGQHLLISTGIGGLSTGVYATFTHDSNDYRDRKNEYPSIVDQLDDIYHNGIDAWKATIKVTKDKYPKE